MKQILAEATSFEETAQRAASLVVAPVGLLTAVATFLLNLNRTDIPLSGDVRAMGPLFALYTIAIVLIAGGTAYYLGVQYHNQRVAEKYRQPWRLRLVPILLAVLVLAILAVDIGTQLINNAFQELVLPTLQAVFLMGVFSAGLANIIVDQMFRMSLRRLLSVIFLIMVVGLYYSAVAVSADDPLWWQESFSYLGTLDNPGSLLFNATFVFAGILVLVLHPYFMYDFNILHDKGALSDRGHLLIRLSLGALGILVAGVGLFIFGASPLQTTLHNLSAYTMAGIVFLYMVGLWWLIPKFPRSFYVTTGMFIIAMIATGLLMVLGRMNVTQAEINGFFLGGAWLATFVNETDYLARRLAPEAFSDLARK